MPKILFALLASSLISPMSFAQNILQTPATKESNVKLVVKSKLIFDKIVYDNQADFEKNIPIEKINFLVNSYAKALQTLTFSSQENSLRIIVIFDKTSQSFNIQTKNDILPQNQEFYNKSYAGLNAVERPIVNTKLKMFVLFHLQPL